MVVGKGPGEWFVPLATTQANVGKLPGEGAPLLLKAHISPHATMLASRNWVRQHTF